MATNRLQLLRFNEIPNKKREFICYWLIYNLLLDQFKHFFLWKVARSSTSTDSPFFCINQLINGGGLIRLIA